jgi:hypothetical protein
MRSQNWVAQALVVSVAALAVATALAAEPTASSVVSNIDLSKPFATRAAWRLIATQGPPDDDTPSGGEEPGPIQLCLRAARSAPCDRQLQTAPAESPFEPHYLNGVEIVYPRGGVGQPLLFVQTASEHSINGDQSVFTQMLAYKNSEDHFVRIYQHTTGRNNNQEVRYISTGMLKGDIISAEPTENAPFGYWVTVNVLTPRYTYKTMLRYRSATRYFDSNSLAVIDSEMPNIEQRLGYWKPGMALPLPSGPCAKPRLIRMELWCD